MVRVCTILWSFWYCNCNRLLFGQHFGKIDAAFWSNRLVSGVLCQCSCSWKDSLLFKLFDVGNLLQWYQKGKVFPWNRTRTTQTESQCSTTSALIVFFSKGTFFLILHSDEILNFFCKSWKKNSWWSEDESSFFWVMSQRLFLAAINWIISSFTFELKAVTANPLHTWTAPRTRTTKRTTTKAFTRCLGGPCLLFKATYH